MKRWARFLIGFSRSWRWQLVVGMASVPGMVKALAFGLVAWKGVTDMADFGERHAGKGEVVPVEVAMAIPESIFVTGLIVGTMFATSAIGLGWVVVSVFRRRGGSGGRATEQSASGDPGRMYRSAGSEG